MIKFKPSPKIYKNYKSAHPAKTIFAIKKSLKKLGIDLNKLKYEEGKVGNSFSIYSGQVTYNNNYIASGKGSNHLLSEASVYSEIVERISVGLSLLIPYLEIKKNLQTSSFLSGYSHNNRKKIKNSVELKELFKYLPFLDVKNMENKKISSFWSNAFSLTEKHYKKIPHLLIKKISGSNGCASGNTLEEATSQAFCEICERYSLIEHIRKKISAPTVDLKTIKDKEIHDAIDLFNSMNIDVEIKDLTLGNKVPVMGVLFTNNNLSHEKNTLKKKMFYKTLHAGSHLDLKQAIMRCFSEEWQMAGKDIQFFVYHREFDFIDHYFTKKEKEKIIEKKKVDFHHLAISNRSFENFSFLNEKKRYVSFDSLSSYPTDDFLEDIKIIKNISENNGWETLVVDYSIPELPLKVVRVIVPSISDLLKYDYLNPRKVTDIIEEKRITNYPLDLFFQNKKSEIKELIYAVENDLVEKIVTPIPSSDSLKYSPSDIFTILRIGHSVIGDKNKKSRINSFKGRYFERKK